MMTALFSAQDWLASNIGSLKLDEGERLTFSEYHLDDYAALLEYVCQSSREGVVIPAVYIFKQKYQVHSSSTEAIRKALDLTISVSRPAQDLADLDRLQMASMFLSSVHLERSECSYFSFVEAVLSSSHEDSLRSARLYSRAILQYCINGQALTHDEIVKHAASSVRLLYALIDLDCDGCGDVRYGMPVANILERSCEAHYRHWPVYNIIKSLYEDPVERMEKMAQLVMQRGLPAITLPATLMQ